MYTIIFIAAFLTASYLWHINKLLMARIAYALLFLVGIIVSSMVISYHQWQDVNSAFFTAMLIALLVELYIKLGRFEVKAKKQKMETQK
jgi:uncharacterized protein (UPF0333 family)